jgi:Response regulator containing CheY-like receiver, AAA-type ATPase, and DNA-binding domains
VVQIKIPPLKERRKDINLLFDYFLKEMSTRLNRHLTGVDPVVLNYLESYDWPGNIRELQNVVERILLVSEDGFITKEHLPREIIKTARETSGDEAQSHAPWLSNRDMRKKYALEQEREQILKALDDQGGNISKAAASLGISRSTLYRKMKGYYITN